MDYYFFDSSGIVKNYVIETGTNWVQSIFNSVATNVIYAVSIAEVEVIAAFARRLKGKTLTVADAATASAQFRYDFVNDLRVVEIEPILLNRAVDLAEKYALRGYDAVQLAAALEIYTRLINLKIDFTVSTFTFVSADNELNSAAQNEGLTVENPNNYS
ncbi:MAG: type II toxin-antitoxin system VapC family toxin [Pyrinomonadaceae bacterium]|nr:type II toxin-antitoxin system VapC family toxin [Pyrinomonadaceae bacterium]